jgi:hypothetical protein
MTAVMKGNREYVTTVQEKQALAWEQECKVLNYNNHEKP